MPLTAQQQRRLVRLAERERRARAAADTARADLADAIRQARWQDGATVREIAGHVGLSPQRVWQIGLGD